MKKIILLSLMALTNAAFSATPTSTPSSTMTPTPSMGDAMDQPGLAFSYTGPPWTVDSSVFYYNGASAKAPSPESPNAQYSMQTTVTGPAYMSFYSDYSPINGTTSFNYTVDGVTPYSVSTFYNSFGQQGVWVAAGTHVIQWTVHNLSGGLVSNDQFHVDDLQLTPGTPSPTPSRTHSATPSPTFTVSPTSTITPTSTPTPTVTQTPTPNYIETAVEFAPHIFRTGGNEPYVVSASQAYTGSSAACGTNPYTSGYLDGWMETDVQGPGVLSFWWTDNFHNYSQRNVSVDGGLVLATDYSANFGPMAWNGRQVRINGGLHSVRWAYNTYNSSGSNEESCIDAISFSPDDPGSTAGRVLNYPNPFIPGKQSISFAFEAATTAHFEVFDLSGQRVSNMAAKTWYCNPASGYASWDGRKDDGGMLTAGVYLYFVKTDKATYKGKITVGKQ